MRFVRLLERVEQAINGAGFDPRSAADVSKMSQMLKSSGALAAATLTSRILGMVREIVYARFMGDGWVASAFTMAFMVPNLFRRLLGEGALSAAFIPIFKQKEQVAGEKETWRAANAVLCGLLTVTAILVLAGIVGVSVVLAVGHFERRAETELMLRLLRVMFPYLLLVCAAAMFMGLCNARNHFFVPALGAAMLNVVMVASVLWLAPRLGLRLQEQIFGLAIGVLLAGVVQAGFQWPILRKEGFRLAWVSPFQDETVRQVVRQMLPGIVGVAAYQINLLITQGLAFWLDTPSSPIVASFYYAVRLMELPQGVFGLSLATYLLPTLSGLAAQKEYPRFRETLKQGLGYLVYINLLASVLLMVLAEPIIRLLFERGRFEVDSTLRAYQALAYLAPGLIAFSATNILARAFFALGDTRTPMRISVMCLALNAILTAALLFPMRHRGLGLANTLSAWANVVLLGYALRRVMPKLEFAALRRELPWLAGAVAMAGLAAWGLLRYWERHFGHAHLWSKLGEVFVPAGVAALLYFPLTYWSRVPAAHEFVALMRNRLLREP
jgi:putative peptidoglycan lipid II flippase